MSTNSPKQPGGKPHRGGHTSPHGAGRKNEHTGEGGRGGSRGGSGHRQAPNSNTSNGQSGGKPSPQQGSKHSAPRERNVPVPGSVLENAMLHALGQLVTVTLKNGEKWTGIFHSSAAIAHSAPSPAAEVNKSQNGKYGIILRMASRVLEDGNATMEQPTEAMMVTDSELVALRYTLPRRATKGFQTDTEISASAKVQVDRQLTSWAPDHHQGPQVPSMALGEQSHEQGSWNQFEANAALLNTAAKPYSEDLYTTTLDRSSPHYKAKIAEATRLAMEIETGVTEDVHIAEERGQAMQDDGMDEEDRYSMVLSASTAASAKKGAYVVPAMRAKAAAAAAAAATAGSGGGNASTSATQNQAGGAKRGGNQTGGAPSSSAALSIPTPSSSPAHPPGIKQPGSPTSSSSPVLSGLNLAAEGTAVGSPPQKRFQPWSTDPTKSTSPNPATRTEDTAKLRKSSTEIDEKVRAATANKNGSASPTTNTSPTSTNNPSSSSSTTTSTASSSGAATPISTTSATATSTTKKDMRSFLGAATYGGPGQRLLDSLGSAPKPAAPVVAPVAPAPVAYAPVQQHPHMVPTMANPMMPMHMPQQQQQQQQQAHHSQHPPMEAPPNAGFRSLLRADVDPRPVSEIYRTALNPTSIDAKHEWERKQQMFPYNAGPFGFPNQFAFQAMPQDPRAMPMPHMMVPYGTPQYPSHP